MWYKEGAFAVYTCEDRAEAIGFLRAFLKKVGFARLTSGPTVAAVSMLSVCVRTAVPIVCLQPSLSRLPRVYLLSSHSAYVQSYPVLPPGHAPLSQQPLPSSRSHAPPHARQPLP